MRNQEVRIEAPRRAELGAQLTLNQGGKQQDGCVATARLPPEQSQPATVRLITQIVPANGHAH